MCYFVQLYKIPSTLHSTSTATSSSASNRNRYSNSTAIASSEGFEVGGYGDREVKEEPRESNGSAVHHSIEQGERSITTLH